MPKQTLTITLEADRKAELDRVARAQGRDRDALIDEALANWLDLQTWQTREIEAGLTDAETWGNTGRPASGCAQAVQLFPELFLADLQLKLADEVIDRPGTFQQIVKVRHFRG